MLKTIFSLLLIAFASSIALAQEPSSPLIYRVFDNDPQFSFQGGYISLINPLNQQEIKQIKTNQAINSIVVTPDNKRAFVTPRAFPPINLGLLVIDIPTQTIKSLFETSAVYQISLDPNGMLWIVLGSENQIIVVNPQTLTVTARITDLDSPRDIAFSPDNKRFYVSLENSDIVVFDSKSKTPIKTIKNLPPSNISLARPMELAVSPDSKRLCIGGKNTITIIDTTTFQIIDSFSFNNRSFFNTTALLFNNTSNTIYVIEPNGFNLYQYSIDSKQLTTIFTSDRFSIQEAKLSQDGRLLYISLFGSKAIIDAQSNEVIFNLLERTSISNPVSEGIYLTGDFSIGQAPSLQTTAPAANQQIAANQAFSIKWQTTVMPQSYSIASHKIELSTDGGMTFNVIPGAEQLKPEAQDFTWQVPDIETSKAQIRVSTVDLGARRASSTTMNFTISRNGGGGGDTQAPMVSFLSPKGGETFNSGDSLQISWSSSDNVGVTSQDLSLSTDGGSTFPITLANGLSGSAQQFTYQIPMSLQSNQTRLKLVVRDGAGNMAQATTPSNFSIMLGADNIPPTVTISQPTQSQSIIAGQAIQVKWQSTDNRAVVSQALLLSFDNGKTFSQIASFGATDSSFTLSNIDRLSFTTPQAIVKITAVDSTGNKGEANATFTISPAITNANYQTKVLTITGIGFMSNVNNNIKLIVNDKEVTLTPSNVSNSSFIIKGNKKKLNVVKGSNTIRLVVDGIMSNSIQFTF